MNVLTLRPAHDLDYDPYAMAAYSHGGITSAPPVLNGPSLGDQLQSALGRYPTHGYHPRQLHPSRSLPLLGHRGSPRLHQRAQHAPEEGNLDLLATNAVAPSNHSDIHANDGFSGLSDASIGALANMGNSICISQQWGTSPIDDGMQAAYEDSGTLRSTPSDELDNSAKYQIPNGLGDSVYYSTAFNHSVAPTAPVLPLGPIPTSNIRGGYSYPSNDVDASIGHLHLYNAASHRGHQTQLLLPPPPSANPDATGEDCDAAATHLTQAHATPSYSMIYQVAKSQYPPRTRQNSHGRHEEVQHVDTYNFNPIAKPEAYAMSSSSVKPTRSASTSSRKSVPADSCHSVSPRSTPTETEARQKQGAKAAPPTSAAGSISPANLKTRPIKNNGGTVPVCSPDGIVSTIRRTMVYGMKGMPPPISTSRNNSSPASSATGSRMMYDRSCESSMKRATATTARC
ncbi:hypothetical protein DRE_05140 [Drechslerella stenobrocha 248]|uniref:Uncharacterized protein n=1 Tax=Drechslerella stenobrocha 248 TaxID=1043628 RepID=W7I0P5_9PEZI|nr:hypothetical protein DRE_05140 [Drechslerella stenobrocha 248]